jgi:hypothetical protein
MLMWKMHRLVYRKKLLGPKSLGKGDKNGSGFVVIVGCDIGNQNSCENQLCIKS